MGKENFEGIIEALEWEIEQSEGKGLHHPDDDAKYNPCPGVGIALDFSDCTSLFKKYDKPRWNSIVLNARDSYMLGTQIRNRVQRVYPIQEGKGKTKEEMADMQDHISDLWALMK